MKDMMELPLVHRRLGWLLVDLEVRKKIRVYFCCPIFQKDSVVHHFPSHSLHNKSRKQKYQDCLAGNLMYGDIISRIFHIPIGMFYGKSFMAKEKFLP